MPRYKVVLNPVEKLEMEITGITQHKVYLFELVPSTSTSTTTYGPTTTTTTYGPITTTSTYGPTTTTTTYGPTTTTTTYGTITSTTTYGPTFTFIVNATSDNYNLSTFQLKGNNGKTINIDWGDTNNQNVTFIGTAQPINKTYTLSGNYTVTFSGNIEDWTYLYWGFWNCTLNVENLPIGLTEIDMSFLSDNVTGEIDKIPCSLTRINILYCSGLNGNISELYSELQHLSINYCSTNWTGNVVDLNNNLLSLQFSNLGDNVYIDIADLPRSITNLNIAGTDNHFTGDLSDLPLGLTTFDLFACGSKITGTISDLPSGIVNLRLWANTNNLITGNIQDIPTGSKSPQFVNLLLVSGDINTLCSNVSNISMITIQFLNNITGEIGNLPNTITSITLRGSGNLWTYNITYPYWANLNGIQIIQNGFNQSKVDAILTDVVAGNRSNGYMDLRGNSVPSATGLLDKATLQSRGWTVYTD